MIYETADLTDRKIYMDILKKIKVNYFNYCINKFCFKKNVNIGIIRGYMDINFVGSYIGVIKIK